RSAGRRGRLRRESSGAAPAQRCPWHWSFYADLLKPAPTRCRQAGNPSSTADPVCRPAGRVSELPQVTEHAVVLARMDVREPMALIEASGVRVDLVHVDVHLRAAPLPYAPDRLLQQLGAQPAA